jgi:hypothetical protein
MAKRDLDRIIGKLEDAKETVEAARDNPVSQDNDERLEEVEQTIDEVTDELEQVTDRNAKKG